MNKNKHIFIWLLSALIIIVGAYIIFYLEMTWLLGIILVVYGFVLGGFLFGMINELNVAEEFAKLSESKLERVAESAKAILWEYDITKDQWTYVSPQVEKILGYLPEEWETLNFWVNHIHHNDRDWAVNYCLECTKRGEEHTFEYRFIKKNGQIAWLRDEVTVEMDGNTPVKLRGLMVDITSLKQIQQELNSEKERLFITLNSIGDGVISVDANEKIFMVNPVAERLTGWTSKEVVGRDFTEVFDIINERTREKCENVVSEVMSSGKQAELANYTTLISKSGDEIPIADSAAPIKDDDGNIQGVIVVFRDVSEERQYQKEIEHLSFHDKLTGVYNRAFFEQELKRRDSENNLPISIIMGDMNALKMVNDGLGHEKGDKLLKLIADILKDVCRKDDIIARWGGDEFVILFSKTDTKAVDDICKRIKNECTKRQIDQLKPSISLGRAVKYDRKQNIYKVLREAEEQMYKDKLTEGPKARSLLLCSLENILYEKSYETKQHVKEITRLAVALGKELGLNEKMINDLEQLTRYHDIGKVGIDKEILLKESSLTEDEWESIETHSDIGYRLMAASKDLSHLATPIFALHERWDGTGYPQGLKEEQIPGLARIVAIVEAYDVMTNGRPYRPAITKEEALKEIRDNSGTQFDPKIVNTFIKIISKG